MYIHTYVRTYARVCTYTQNMMYDMRILYIRTYTHTHTQYIIYIILYIYIYVYNVYIYKIYIYILCFICIYIYIFIYIYKAYVCKISEKCSQILNFQSRELNLYAYIEFFRIFLFFLLRLFIFHIHFLISHSSGDLTC